MLISCLSKRQILSTPNETFLFTICFKSVTGDGCGSDGMGGPVDSFLGSADGCRRSGDKS